MGELSEIANELRDEVLQTILAVRLNLAYADPGQEPGSRSEAQALLATEARRLRVLIDRLGSLAMQLDDELNAEDVAA